MPKIYECQTVHSEVTALGAWPNNTIAVSTKMHGMIIFEADACQKNQILSIAQLNRTTTAIAIHPNENICAVANNQIIYIVSLADKSILETIHTNNGTVHILSFLSQSPYIVGGTKEGRVVLYRYDGHTEISRLFSLAPVKKNGHISNRYITALASHRHYIACAGYGGCVFVIHLHSYRKIKIFYDSKVSVSTLCFIDEKTLLFANTDGTLYFQSLKSKENVFSIKMPFSNVQNIIHFPTSDFAVVSGKSHSISLINVRTRKLVSPIYILFEDEVHTMTLTHKQDLIVILKNRQIHYVKFENKEELQACILRNDLPKAFEMIDTDPRFQGTKEHKKIESSYNQFYKETFNYLIGSNKKELKKNINILKRIHSKRNRVKLLFDAYSNYPKFKLFYLERKYALAYKLCDKYPPLQYTLQYKKMNESFQKAFALAQKQILTGNLDLAKSILNPFATVLSKRPLINLLLRQNKEFLTFLKALQNKEYKTICSLVSKYEIFKDIPGYTAIQKSQENLLTNITKAINSGKTEDAIQQIDSLRDLTCSQEALRALYDNAFAVEKLLKSYEKNDFKKCYELLDSDIKLQELQIAKLLEKHWQKLMYKCEKFALIGNIQKIKETLSELIAIPTRAQRTGDLLRLSFYTQIKLLISTHKFKNAENIIYSYIDIFGMDKEIRIIMKNYEKSSTKKLAVTHEQGKKRSRESWLHSQLFMHS